MPRDSKHSTKSQLHESDNHSVMRGLGRSPTEQALENTRQALRVLDMTPRAPSDMIPHPMDVLRAEIQNAARYLAIALEESSDSA